MKIHKIKQINYLITQIGDLLKINNIKKIIIGIKMRISNNNNKLIQKKNKNGDNGINLKKICSIVKTIR